jgi:transposase
MLRLARDGVSAREIGRTLGVARSTIQDNLKRASTTGLAWPLAGDLTDAVLEQRLFAHAGVRRGFRRRREPDWASLACELKRPGVNLMVLWEEYRAVHPEGYGYSRFCDLFREFERRLSPTMRQDHPAGDKVFVDYSGKKIMIFDRETGVVRDAEIFVAVLGASNYTYAEATWTQTLPDWIEAHVRMFRFFGGVPRLVVPDNLKSGVHRASFYDPEINRSYGMMASHYGVGILPARPRKPRDKAKVEAGVRFAQTYILGRLRRQTFFSLAETNAAIAAALERINAHVMRRIGVSRRQLFETVEMPVLAPLPDADYQFAEWLLARVSLDYHVEVDGFFYSVPHGLIREQVDVRATTRTIEFSVPGQRESSPARKKLCWWQPPAPSRLRAAPAGRWSCWPARWSNSPIMGACRARRCVGGWPRTVSSRGVGTCGAFPRSMANMLPAWKTCSTSMPKRPIQSGRWSASTRAQSSCAPAHPGRAGPARTLRLRVSPQRHG